MTYLVLLKLPGNMYKEIASGDDQKDAEFSALMAVRISHKSVLVVEVNHEYAPGAPEVEDLTTGL